MNDPINHPSHYTNHPSGVECITITEHLNFCIGNAVKYLWRAGLKGDALEDLQKARWYIDREIGRLTDSSPAETDSEVNPGVLRAGARVTWPVDMCDIKGRHLHTGPSGKGVFDGPHA